MSDIAGLGPRARIDAGTLGVVAVTVNSARQAVNLLRRGRGNGLILLHAIFRRDGFESHLERPGSGCPALLGTLASAVSGTVFVASAMGNDVRGVGREKQLLAALGGRSRDHPGACG
jgi:hypothetical protein